jgi:cell wall-associated NlpC family hydrolase
LGLQETGFSLSNSEIMGRQEPQRTAREILLPNGRRISTVYKGNYPGGNGPVLLTSRSVWWATRDMVFREDLPSERREVYLPWNGAKGTVLALTQDAIRVQTDTGERRIRPSDSTFDGYVRAVLGPRTEAIPPGVYQKVATEIEQWIGTPYVYGGSSRAGCDCSGFVTMMLAVAGKRLPRTSGAIAKAGEAVVGELRWGDVVCHPGHVALYIGNGRTAEAYGTPDKGGIVTRATIWHRGNNAARRFL